MISIAISEINPTTGRVDARTRLEIAEAEGQCLAGAFGIRRHRHELYRLSRTNT